MHGGLLSPLPIAATRLSDAHRLIAVDMHGWPQRPPGTLAQDNDSDEGTRGRIGRWLDERLDADDAGNPDTSSQAPERALGFAELMSRSLDTMQAQISRVQIALDPPEIVIAIPRDACQFYEFWRGRELIEIGRREADKVLDAAGY